VLRDVVRGIVQEVVQKEQESTVSMDSSKSGDADKEQVIDISCNKLGKLQQSLNRIY
jgi:hypothetical protein